ncbi:MAG: FAD-dependent oxidoreductase [Nitrospinota bacterium]
MGLTYDYRGVKIKKVDIAVIGAGPAGLGAGAELSGQTGVAWEIFEASNRVGGLASSRVDRNGFTWDLGGHVIFSKSRIFNSAVKNALGGGALTHIRDSFVKMKRRFIPFPVQNNIHRLPVKVSRECLEGMKKAASSNGKPADFEEWIGHTLGGGLAKHFMVPYNKKLWAYPLSGIGFGWIDGRVSLPPLKSVLGALRNGRDETRWGPNATFVFPLKGGTGGLFKKIAEPFAKKINFRKEAVEIDPEKKIVRFKDGAKIKYKKMITAAPLDRLVTKIISGAPPEVVEAAKSLCSNSGWMVGIGVNRKIRTKRCWVYFPNEKTPFYRVTYFSNYSPCNVPDPKRQTSLLCEISTGSSVASVNGADIADRTIDALINEGILRKSDRNLIATRWKIRLPYLYPIPTLKRDAALKTIHPWLKKQSIYSIGRFGGWRYEEGNMDHAYLAGRKTAGLLVDRRDE